MTAFYPGTPPTRILSWLQMVQEADPGWNKLRLQPWVYDFSNGRLFIDPLPLYSFVFGEGLEIDSGVLIVTDATGWPTGYVGLPAGAVWSNGGDANGNGGAVAVIPGLTPSPSAMQQFFGQISAAQLLALGGGQMPLYMTSNLGQIWNNGGELAVVLPPLGATALENDNGVLILAPGSGWPLGTDIPGAFYSDAGVAAIAPGGSYNGGPAIFYGQITARQLLALTGNALPPAPTFGPGSLQLYNASGQVQIA